MGEVDKNQVKIVHPGNAYTIDEDQSLAICCRRSIWPRANEATVALLLRGTYVNERLRRFMGAGI